MKDDTLKLLLVVSIILLAVIALAGITRRQQKGYQGQSRAESGVGGWWSGLWDNAANIVDAGGRHTSSFVTSLGNMITSIISTKKTGKAVFSEYGYSDPKIDYGPYLLAGAMVVTAGVVFAVALSKK